MTENERRRMAGLLLTEAEYAAARFFVALAQLQRERWHLLNAIRR